MDHRLVASHSRSFSVLKMHLVKYTTECNYIVDLECKHQSTGNEGTKVWE